MSSVKLVGFGVSSLCVCEFQLTNKPAWFGNEAQIGSRGANPCDSVIYQNLTVRLHVCV